MTKATVVVASHGVEICSNMANMVISLASNCVIGTSNTYYSMECIVPSLVTKTIT